MMKLSVDINALKDLSISSNKEESQKVREQCVRWEKLEKLSFLTAIEKNTVNNIDIHKIKETVKLHQFGSTNKKIKHFVLLGMGGSSLGAETLIRALHSKYKEPYFYFLNNNDPDFFSEILDFLDPETTLFYVVSKSGETLETWSQFLVSINWLNRHFFNKKNAWKQHIVICTEFNNRSLESFGKTHDLNLLEMSKAIGGRFSVFTPCALFPAAFAGLNIEDIVNGAKNIKEQHHYNNIKDSAAFQVASSIYKNPEKSITVCFSYSSYLEAFGRWFEQLWGESLGKAGKGLSPFAAIGTTDQHSQLQLFLDGPKDKIIAFIRIGSAKNHLEINKIGDFNHILNENSMWRLFQAEFQATKDILSKKNIPNFTLILEDRSEESMGELLCFWLYVTIYIAAFMEIDPFTQDAVEEGKALAKVYLRDVNKT